MGFVFLFSFSLFLIIKEAVIFTHLRISLYSVYLNGTDMKSVSSLVKSDICNVTVFHMLLSLCYIFFFVKLENCSVQVLFSMMVMLSWEIHLISNTGVIILWILWRL